MVSEPLFLYIIFIRSEFIGLQVLFPPERVRERTHNITEDDVIDNGAATIVKSHIPQKTCKYDHSYVYRAQYTMPYS